jgi:hypothetical protein
MKAKHVQQGENVKMRNEIVSLRFVLASNFVKLFYLAMIEKTACPIMAMK